HAELEIVPGDLLGRGECELDLRGRGRCRRSAGRSRGRAEREREVQSLYGDHFIELLTCSSTMSISSTRISPARGYSRSRITYIVTDTIAANAMLASQRRFGNIAMSSPASSAHANASSAITAKMSS